MSELSLDGFGITFLAGTLGQGGAEQQLFYILRALKACGASVRLLSLTRGEFWEEPILHLGVPVIWVGENPSRAVRLIRITKELALDKPRILQSQHFYVNLYTALAARMLGLCDIGAIRSDVWSEIRSNGKVLGRLSLRLPRALAVNSAAAIRNAATSGVPRQRLHLLPNVVDTDHFSPALSRRTNEVRIISAGRMTPEKRHDRFLRILAELRRKTRIPVTGIIAGDGPLRANIEGEAAVLGLLPDGVRFLGYVPDLAPIYQSVDIFLLTSDYEGTPNVLLEAMACGIPVVATRVGGVPDLVEDGVTGILVDPNRTGLLVEILLDLIQRADKRLEVGASARRRVETCYSSQSLPRALRGLYESALQ